MEEYIKNLIAIVGQDGGYFITPGAVVDDAEPENVHAYLKAAREHGVY
jgi:hypothetical protein